MLEGWNVCAHAFSVCGVLDVGGALHKGRERERVSESERDLLQWLMGVFCETQPGAEHNHGPRLTLQQTCPSHGKERGLLLPPAHHPAWLLPLLHLPSYCSPGRERETEKVSVSTTASMCVEAGNKADSLRPAGSALSQGCASFSVLLNMVFKHTLTWVHFQWGLCGSGCVDTSPRQTGRLGSFLRLWGQSWSECV